VWSVEDGVLTVPGDATCAEVEAAARPWLFASDRPDLTVRAWIDRGGGDLLWGLLGPTRAQVLGIEAELPRGRRVRFGGRVVKNVAGYDLARAFVGARGELGRVVAAHLRVRPPPRGWRAAVRRGTGIGEALAGEGCAVWTGDTWRFLRAGEATPGGYEEMDALLAREELRRAWALVRSFRPVGEAEGVVLAAPGVVGSGEEGARDRGPLWARLKEALASAN
jgi:FAD/FMN-containing dehydrogenase